MKFTRLGNQFSFSVQLEKHNIDAQSRAHTKDPDHMLFLGKGITSLLYVVSMVIGLPGNDFIFRMTSKEGSTCGAEALFYYYTFSVGQDKAQGNGQKSPTSCMKKEM